MSKEGSSKYYYRQRAEALTLLGGKCVECGAVERLEFDHIDPSLKHFTISAKLANTALKDILYELEKCQLLCYDCHKEKHRVGPVHGTISTYRHYKCRCQACKDVWNEACRRWKGRVAR